MKTVLKRFSAVAALAIIPAVTTLCVGVPSATAAPSTKAASQAFKSTKGYSLTPPAGWQINKSGIMGSDVVIFARPAKNFAANMNVAVLKATPGETLESAKKQIATMLPRAFNGFKMLEQSYVTIAGSRALRTTYTHKIGTPARVLWMQQIATSRGGQVYTFTCTALNEDRAAYKTAFESALKSVRWTK